MIGWLVDTNVIASLIAPDGAPSVKVWAREVDENRLYISVLTLAEYDKGIEQLAEDNPNRLRFAAIRDQLEARFRSRVLPLSNGAIRRWGAIAGRVKRDTGHPPPVIDTMIAAIAVEADLYLVTRNVRDVRHSGCAVFNPWADDVAAFPLNSPKKRGRVLDLG